MYSNQDNLRNPLKVIDEILELEVDTFQYPKVVTLTEDEYQRINKHDPHTIYIAYTTEIDNDCKQKFASHNLYYGDIKVKYEDKVGQYFLGTTTDDSGKLYYELYVNINRYLDNKLIPIAKFKDPQAAINAINLYNHTGTHMDLGIKIRKILIHYFEKNINMKDLLIGLIRLIFDTNDIRIQSILEFVNYEDNHVECNYDHYEHLYDRDLSHLLIEDLAWNPACNKDDPAYISVFVLYKKLYNITVKYDFPKNKKYYDINVSWDDVDLSSEITNICELLNLYK